MEKIITSNNALPYLYDELNKRTMFLWRMQNGQLIDIKDMTDEHLLNTIKHLEKKKAEQEFVNEAIASYPYDF